MAAQIVSEIRTLISMVPKMAICVYNAFLRLFTKPTYMMTGTTTFEYVYDGQNGLNALGIFTVCAIGLGLAIGLVRLARGFFGSTR